MNADGITKLSQVPGRGDGGVRRQDAPTGGRTPDLSLGKEVRLWDRLVIRCRGLCRGKMDQVLVGTDLT